jgi:hypothetical protein
MKGYCTQLAQNVQGDALYVGYSLLSGSKYLLNCITYHTDKWYCSRSNVTSDWK